MMDSNNLPENYKGYKIKDLLLVWEEIKAPGGTKAPEDMITAMDSIVKKHGNIIGTNILSFGLIS